MNNDQNMSALEQLKVEDESLDEVTGGAPSGGAGISGGGGINPGGFWAWLTGGFNIKF